LYQLIKQKIQSGAWQPGRKLPSEHELCDHLSVSRTVVRQALSELANEELISTHKGKGSFVSGVKHNRHLMDSLSGFYDDAVASGQDVYAQVLDFRLVDASDEVAQFLNIPKGDRVIFLKRLRHIDGEPVMLGTTHIPERFCPGLLDEDLTHQSLYRVLANKFNLQIAEGVRTIESVNASESLAELLQVEVGAALSMITGIMYLRDGTPLEYGISWHRGDRSRFQVRLVNAFK
jgi:GntR family transcriptional regulator